MRSLESSSVGRLVPTVDGALAFIPAALPREVTLSPAVVYQLDRASRAIATLAGVGETLSNPHLLIQPFMRREAVLSSRIEGTLTSLSGLFRYEASVAGRMVSDAPEVYNYIRALDKGLELLNTLPLSLRLFNEVHGTLLRGVRGKERHPGELRQEQNWIGAPGSGIREARYVPPPPTHVRDLLLDLERFANEKTLLPPLVQCALMHYQFEAIHPYHDGNGRVGRLLIMLFLRAKDLLPKPLLYLSAYFERDRQAYYAELFRVSQAGEWQTWLAYFLKGVEEQAKDALELATRIRALHEEQRVLLLRHKETAVALKALDELFTHPYVTAPSMRGALGTTPAGTYGVLNRLKALGLVEVFDETRPKLYIAQRLIDLLEPSQVRAP